MSHARAIITLLIGATLISSSPVFVKLAAQQSMGPTAIGFWRTLIGAVALFLTARMMGKPLKLMPGALRIAFLAGFLFFVDLYVWHRSIIYVGAGMATILGNTQVFMVAIISYLIFRERVTLKFILAAITAFVGLALLVGVGSDDVQFTVPYIKGILFGLATGLAYSCYLISIRRGQADSSHPDVMVFVAWVSLFSAGFLGVTAAFEGALFLPDDLQSIGSVVGLGLIVQALAWWIIAAALPDVVTARAGLILLLQPTLAMVWGVLLFAEYLSIVQVSGAIITLAAMYAGSIRGKASEPLTKKAVPDKNRL